MNNQKMDRNFYILYTLLWPVFHIFFPFRVIGLERLPDGAALLCPNHTAWTDPFLVAFALGRHPIRAMAKAELIRWPIIGPMLERAGVFGVERGSADLKAAKTALKCLKDGKKLLLFPEGTRVHEGETADAKAGAALFATRAKVPMVPIYIEPKKERLFYRTAVVIGQPYMPAYEGRKASSEELQAIASNLMERVQALKEEL